MNLECIPIVWSSAVITNSRTIFNLIDEEICLEIPKKVMQELLGLCDGSRRLKEVVNTMSLSWEKESIELLIDHLMQKQIIIEGKDFAEKIYKSISNPMPLSANIDEESVAQLPAKAIERHRSLKSDTAYFPSANSLFEIINNRKSIRSFSGESVDFQSIIDLLWSAYGECQVKDGSFHRSVPSAGALYPLMIHIALFIKTGDWEPGIYRVVYGEQGSVGLKIVSSDTLKFIRAILDPLTIQDRAHGVISISCSFKESTQKYSNRGVLYSILEAGHAAQNILLAATSQNIATCELGGFIDELLAQAIGLSGSYRPLTVIAFGKEGNQNDILDFPSHLEINWAIPHTKEYFHDFSMVSVRLSKDLDWSHGRHPSPQIALTKAVSESKEWTACGNIPQLTYAAYCDLNNAINPREIIRFHKNQYRLKNFPLMKFNEKAQYGWTKGIDLDGNEFYILADLVYFPYPSKTPYCYSSSSGCAAHPNRQKAIETATLELIERDAFINSYLCRLKMPIISLKTLPSHIKKRVGSLQDAGFRVWIIDHSLDLAPVIFVFVQSEKHNFTTCASCSSFDIEYAISHALMEAESSVLYRLQHGEQTKMHPYKIMDTEDHGRLYSQKQYFKKANFLTESQKMISFQEVGHNLAKSWHDLVSIIHSKGWKHIAIPLHLSDDYGGNSNLYITRAIVPGITPLTFGYRQEPGGMKRIYEIASKFGQGSMTYSDLTKFPHPFE